MPVTLAQAQQNTQADIDFAVIDNLRRHSWLFDQIVFDDTATPGTAGGSLTYSWTLLKAARGADFRAFNSEFAAGQATSEPKTVSLKPLGGAFSVDRKLAHLGPATSDSVIFQLQQLLTSIQIRFQQELILGDTAVNSLGFDGLDKLLTGQSTEYLPVNHDVTNGYLNWTISTANTQDLAMTALDYLDDFLSGIVPSRIGSGDLSQPGALPVGVKAILGNTKSISRVRALARKAGQFTQERDDLGRAVEMYGSWNLVDIGDLPDGSAPIIPIESRDPDGAGAGGTVTGLTDLYAVSFGMDAFHGAAMAGVPLVSTYMPDFNQPGAVKSGEIELGPVAAVLRNTRSCGVLRNIKVSGT